jgi:CRP/FNR family cyclic AMP-dependent transcriptional regulator
VDPAIEDVLVGLPILHGLGPADIRAFAHTIRRHSWRRGAVLFSEGEPAEAVHIVVSGRLKIIRAQANGRQNVLAVIGPGEMIGELALFDPGPNASSAVALEDVETATITNASLRPWLTGRPEAALRLLQVLTRRLRRSDDARIDMIYSDVPGRVAKALLDLADRFAEPYPGGGELVEHGLTQEELAQLVGASRETVNKALSDFVSRGWVRVSSRNVVIIDRVRLISRAR